MQKQQHQQKIAKNMHFSDKKTTLSLTYLATMIAKIKVHIILDTKTTQEDT